MLLGLLRDLERETLNPELSVSSLLRKALVVAQQAENKEFSAWIDSELGGYRDASHCPEYRWVVGQVMVENPFHGLQPIVFENPEEGERLSRRPNGQPIAEIETLLEKLSPASTLAMPFQDDIALPLIRKIGLPSPPTTIVSYASMVALVDGVRTTLLRWIMNLQGETVKQLLNEIEVLRRELDARELPDGTDTNLALKRLSHWSDRASGALEKVGLSREASQLRSAATAIHRGSPDETLYARRQGADTILQALAEEIEQAPDFWRQKLSQANPKDAPARAASVIFLGHGGNALWARVQLHLEKDLKLTIEAYESESRAGLHTVDILKGLLDRCGFAVIIVTAEDQTAKGDLRARQNVVHEIGLFQGRLGFEKVALLMQEGVEEFSNLAGLQHIAFKGNAIEGAFYRLDEMLRRDGLVK
jgi:predicted nucleotide-binding protein